MSHTPAPWRVTHLPATEKENQVASVRGVNVVGPYSVATCGDDARLVSAAPQMAEVLKAYEKWEADVILCDEAWGGGMEPLPTIPQHLWDRLVEIQGMRNAALAKARGEEQQ